MGFFVAVRAKADIPVGTIGGEQRWLAPEMGDNVGATRTAPLAGMSIAAQHGSSCPFGAHFMVAIERRVDEQSHSDQSETTPPGSERPEQRQRPRRMQQPRSGVPGGLGLPEIPQRRDGIDVALVDAEP